MCRPSIYQFLVFTTCATLFGVLGFADHFRAQEPKKSEQPPAKEDRPILYPEANTRGKRILRWTLNFETKTSEDYLKQLDASGAILGIPDEKGKLMIVRNLKERPAKPMYEDVKKINRIFWLDDNKDSAKGVGEALKLDVIPSQIVGFFPEEFERNLLKKELEAGTRLGAKGESDIKTTTFKLAIKDGKPVVTVEKIELNKPN